MRSLRYLFLLFIVVLQSHAQLEWADYPYPIDEATRHQIRFGYLTVPETRDSSNTRFLKIGFCVIKSSAKKPSNDAVIYLPGGPGGGMTQAVGYFFEGEPIQKILEEWDVVLFDPRGCGASEPQLCGELEKPEVFNAQLGGISQQKYIEIIANAMQFCKDSLLNAEINLLSYGSADVAQDVEDLRIALGYGQWNLRGHSYGTRYAQSVVRQFPTSVRSAILSGVVPSALSYEDGDFNGLIRALRLVFEQCEQDKTYHKDFPNLETQFLDLLQQLEKDPIILKPGTSNLLPNRSLVINPYVLLQGLFSAMYTREGFEMIPLMIRTVAEGKQWIAEPLAIVLGQDDYRNADMFHIIRCNDNPGYRFQPDALVKDRLAAALSPYWIGDQRETEEDLCANLSIPLDSTEQQPIRTDIPMLLYSGEFDPVTPPYYADSVAKYLTNATTLIVPGRGHDTPSAMASLHFDFFKDPYTNEMLVLPKALESAHFLRDISLNKGISALSVKIAKNDYSSLAIVLGILLIAIIAGFGYFSIKLFTAVFNSSQRPFAINTFVPIWVVLLTSILFVGLLIAAMQDGQSIHPYYLVFGIPDKWSFIFNLVWILVAALVISIFSARHILKTASSSSSKTRIFWVISWLGSAGLIIWFWFWGII